LSTAFQISGRSPAFAAQATKRELTLADSMLEFDAHDRDPVQSKSLNPSIGPVCAFTPGGLAQSGCSDTSTIAASFASNSAGRVTSRARHDATLGSRQA
jgi:hypothetical protein